MNFSQKVNAFGFYSSSKGDNRSPQKINIRMRRLNKFGTRNAWFRNQCGRTYPRLNGEEEMGQ